MGIIFISMAAMSYGAASLFYLQTRDIEMSQAKLFLFPLHFLRLNRIGLNLLKN